jgi:hypothetical protein
MDDYPFPIHVPHPTFPLSTLYNIYPRQKLQARKHVYHVEANVLLHATPEPIRTATFCVSNWNGKAWEWGYRGKH